MTTMTVLIALFSTMFVSGCWLLDRRASRRQLATILDDEQRSARLAALPSVTVAAVLGEPVPRLPRTMVHRSGRGP